MTYQMTYQTTYQTTYQKTNKKFAIFNISFLKIEI